MSVDIHSFSGGSGAMAGDTLPILRREHRRRSNHGECTATITCRAAWHANHQLGEPPEGWNYAKLLVWQKCCPDLSSISAKPKPNNEVISLGVCNTVFLWQSMDGLGDLAYLASNWFGRSNTKKQEKPAPWDSTRMFFHGCPRETPLPTFIKASWKESTVSSLLAVNRCILQ